MEIIEQQPQIIEFVEQQTQTIEIIESAIIKNETGIASPSWINYATGEYITITPTSVSGGLRYDLLFNESPVYRFVPQPYITRNDAFYSDVALTNLLARKG